MLFHLCKILINHIDKVQLSDLSFFGDIWYAAFGRSNMQNKTINDGGGILPFGGIRCLNAMQTVDKYRNLKEPYIRYFDEDDSWYLRGNIVGTFSQILFWRQFLMHNENIMLEE